MAVLGFAVGAAYLPGIPSAASMPRWWVLAIGLPLASRLDPRALPPIVAGCLALAVAWALIGLSWTPRPTHAALDCLLLGLLCLSASAAASEDGGDAVTGMAYGVAASALLCIPQVLGWDGLAQSRTGPAGTFLNREVLALVAAPLLVWSALGGRRVLAVVLAVPVVFCLSRVAWFAVAAAALWAWRTDLRFKVIAAAAVLLGAATTLFTLGDVKIVSAGARVVLWGAAILSLTPEGRGIGWWAVGHPVPGEEYVHSDILQAMVEFGIGSVLLLAFFAAALRGTRHEEDRAVAGAFIVVGIEAVLSFPLHTPAAGFLAFVLAGRLARDRTRVCRA
jgi:hypothetical protein